MIGSFYAPSRFAPKPAAPTGADRPRGRTLAEALRDPAAVLRVQVVWDRAERPRWTVTAWTDRYRRVDLDDAAQAQLFAWLRETHPAVNWWRPHQYDLERGILGAAPGLLDDGHIPEDDRSFGEYQPPILADDHTSPLPFSAHEPARRAA
jgi:hypothetical protein